MTYYIRCIIKSTRSKLHVQNKHHYITESTTAEPHANFFQKILSQCFLILASSFRNSIILATLQQGGSSP